LEKTGELALLKGVEGADGDPVFEEFTRFGAGFALEGEGSLVSFETRSMVAGLMARSFSLTAGIMPKTGQAAMKGSCRRMRGAGSCGNFVSGRIYTRRRSR
jgi:hypothetical protein